MAMPTAGAAAPSYGSAPPSAPPAAILDATAVNTGQRAKAQLDSYTKDFRRLQTQKQRTIAGVEARVVTHVCMYAGEQLVQQGADAIFTHRNDEQKNRLNLVFNQIRKYTRQSIGRFCSLTPAHTATPHIDDANAYANADLVAQLVRAQHFLLQERRLAWERQYWMHLGGVAIEHTPWVPNATVAPVPVYGPDGTLMWIDTWTKTPLPQAMVESLVAQGQPVERFKIHEELQPTGDVGAVVYSPLQFFIDQRFPTIAQMQPGHKCYLAEVKTIEWLVQTFGSAIARQIPEQSNLSIIRSRLIDRAPNLSGIALADMLPAITGGKGHDDPPMALVITGYGMPTADQPKGTVCVFVPDAAVILEEPLPYGDIPCTDFHWEPPVQGQSFWGGDFVTDMIPAQKFLNKRFSQLGEAANAQVYELMLLGGELSKDDIPTDFIGVVEHGIDDDGSPMVATVPRGQLPTFFLDSIKLILEFFADVAGTSVLSKKNFPGQLRGPLAVPMLQEQIDSEFGPTYEHLGEQLGRLYTQRVARVQQFYPPIRTLKYTGAKRRSQVLSFHTERILRAGVDYTITIEPSSLVPEYSALREARIRERLNSPLAILYVDKRTGMLSADRLAMDLKFTDEHREDRLTQFRRLAQEFITRVERGQPPPTVQPWWDHLAMMDELEAHMATIEFIDTSPQIQTLFFTWYEQHRQAATAQAEAAQGAIESQMMQGAVAQATQQAAARAASVATEAAMAQVQAQDDVANGRDPNQTATFRAMAAGNSNTPPEDGAGARASAPPRRSAKPPQRRSTAA